MHLYASIVRGVENRLYVIRSSNNGISAIISPNGTIIKSIDLNIRDKILASIKPIKITSFYSKTGDWIIIAAIFILIFFLIYSIKKTE
jgi:apolipoprotein N-acyltransferase